MVKRGIVHILPLVVVAVLVVGGLTALSVSHEARQKAAVGKVLSSSDNRGEVKSSDSSGPGSSPEIKIESKTDESKTKIVTKDSETRIKIRTDEGRFETRVEEGREETKIRTGGLRVEIKREGDRVVTKIKNEQDEEVELEDEEEEALLDEVEDELEDKGVRLVTRDNQLGFIQHGRRVRTNFPLSVNASTGELFVTTPAGEKVVAILPDVAIQNMIAAGVLTRVEEAAAPLASPAPGESTPSVSVVEASTELTETDGRVVYLISGVRSQRFFGLVPVDVRLKTVVSAETGQLLDIEQGLLARLLDLVSF